MTTPKKRRASIRCGPQSRQCGNACVPRAKKCRVKSAPLSSSAVQAVLKKENDRIRNLKYEEAVVLDPLTGQKKFSKAGNATSVYFTGAEVEQMKGAVLTHNHPNLGYGVGDPRAKGYSFSPDDINMACRTECVEINAVSQGYNHTLKPPATGWDAQFFNSKVTPSLQANQRKAYTELMNDILQGKMDSRQAQVEYQHRVIAYTAADTGMKYDRAEVGRSDAYLSALETYRADKGKPCGRGFISERKKCSVGGGLSQNTKTEEKNLAKKASSKPRTGRPPDSAVETVVKAVAIATFIHIGVAATVGLASIALEAAEKKINEKEYEEAKKRAKASEEEFRSTRESARQERQSAQKGATEDFKKKWKERTGEDWDDFFRNARANNRSSPGSRAEDPEATPWHQVLGVKPNATAAEIRKAYKAKARQFHPDISEDPQAEEIMKKVNDAFDRSGKRRGDAYTSALGFYRSDKGKPCGRGFISERKKCRGGSLSQAGELDLSARKMKGIPKSAIAGVIAGAALLGVPVVAYLKFRSDYQAGFKDSATSAEKKSFEIEKDLRQQAARRMGVDPDSLTPEQATAFEKADKWNEDGTVSRETLYGVDTKKPYIGFTVGGFHDYGELGFGLANQISAELEDHSVIPLTNKEVQITPEMTWMPMNDMLDPAEDSDGKGGTRYRGYAANNGAEKLGKDMFGDDWSDMREAVRASKLYQQAEPIGRQAVRYVSDFKLLIDNAKDNKHHPDAVNAAAQAMAYHRNFPDKEIHFIAHSGGGFAAVEAAKILEERNIKVKVINVATPSFGLAELPPDRMQTIGAKVPAGDSRPAGTPSILKKVPADTMTLLPMQNFKEIGKPTEHVWMVDPSSDAYKDGQRGYGQRPETYSAMREFLYGTDRSAVLDRKEKRTLASERSAWKARARSGASKTDSFRFDIKGKKCGRGYIPANRKCRLTDGGALRSSSTKRTLSGKTIAATGATLGAISGAAVLGVSADKFLKMRTEYREGFKESASLAKTQADKVEVPDIPDDKSHVTFVTGGFNSGGDAGGRIAAMMEEELNLKGHHFTAIDNYEFDTRTLEEKEAGKDVQFTGDVVDFVKRGNEAFFRSVVKEGRNPVSVKIAANAYAYHQKYPGKTISLVGHSAGGIASHEAAEILEELGVKAQVLTMGSPYFGMTKATEKSMTLASRRDPVVAPGHVMNPKWTSSKGHDFRDYIDSAPKDIEAFLGGTESKKKEDSAATKKRKCVKGKPCKNGCVAKGDKCRVQLSSNATGSLKLVTTGLAGAGFALAANPVVLSAAIAGAAVLGVPLLTYKAQQARYADGFAGSADIAKKQAEGYELPTEMKAGFRSAKEQGFATGLSDSKFSDEEPDQITMVIGGFGGQKGKESDFIGSELSEMFPSHHVVAVESPEFDVTPEPGDNVKSPKFLAKTVKIFMGDAVIEGRNPVAVRAAARAYAYHQKYPNKPINLVGQSGGTMQVREAAEILEKMGVKDVKVVGMGGPYFALTRPIGITLSSSKDPVDKIYGKTMPNKVYVESVEAHSQYLVEGDVPNNAYTRFEERQQGIKHPVNKGTQKVLSDYFDRTKRQDAEIPKVDTSLKLLQRVIKEVYTSPFRIVSAIADDKGTISGMFRGMGQMYDFDISADGKFTYVEHSSGYKKDGLFDDSAGLRSKFLKMLKTLLERSYADGIDQFTAIAISPSADVLGRFRDGQKLVDFSVSKTEVFTQLVDKARRDTDVQVFEQNLLRIDAKADKCIKGLSCGLSCINGKFSCRIKTSKLASAGELAAFRQSATSLRQAEVNSFPSEPAKDKTIRELQKEAREKGVSYANRMNKEQLKRTLQAIDENPAQRARLEKSLTKKREAREAISGTPFAKLVKNWEQFSKVMKLAGVKPEYAIAGAATLITGMTMKAYKDYSQRYRDGYADSATSALNRAEKLGVVSTKKDNILFTVGGFAGEGSTGADMKKRLEDLADTTYPNAIGDKTDMKDRWFRNENEIIAFDSPEFDINGTDIPKKNPDGSYNPAYLGHLTTNGFGTMLKNTLVKGRNEASVELAAQIYAHAKTPGNEGKPINILAHSVGGMTADETLQILGMMPNGKNVVERVNLVKMGTPNLGFLSDRSPAREMGISAGGDPFSFLPTRNERRVNTVQGREIEDFMSNETVIENIRTQFGYHTTSAYGRATKAAKPKPVKSEKKSKASAQGWVTRRGNEAKKQAEERDAKAPAAAPPIPKAKPAINIEDETRSPKPKAKTKKTDSGYLDGVQTWLREDAGETQKKSFAYQLIKRAIASTNPKITRVLTAKFADGELSGHFLDKLTRPHKYSFKDGYLTFKEVQLQRKDFFGGDTCTKGTDCGNSCVRRGSNCRTKLSGASQKMVDQAIKTLQTEQLPSRGETAKLAGALAVDFLKNPVKAVKEGVERERQVKAAIAAHTGEEVASNLELIGAGLKKGSKKMKQYVADNPALVEDMVVNAGGLTGSIAGGALGPVGALAGDAGGALAVRRGLRDIKAVKSAQEKLKKDEAYQAMGRLGKLKTLAKASIQELKSKELREKAGDDLTGDLGGWAIGNSTANALSAAGSGVPLQGAAVAMALTPGVVAGRRKLKEGGTIREAAKEAALAVAAPISDGNKRENEMRAKASKYIGAIKRGGLSKVKL